MSRLLGIGLVAAFVAFSPRSASACSQPPPPAELVGYPADGADDIATDVLPFYNFIYAQLEPESATFRLESMSGDVVPLTVEQRYVWAFVLVPARQLEPHTTYVLSAAGAVDSPPLDPISFTTGPGPVPGFPAAPRGRLIHYEFEDAGSSSCSPARSGTCVSLSVGLPVEVTHIDEFDQETSSIYLHREPWFDNLSGIDQGTNFRCVRLRARSPNGMLSSAVDLCGADAPLAELDGSDDIGCTSEGLTQDGAVVEPGCACNVAGRGGRAGNAALAGLLVLGLLARRRRN